MIRPYPRFRRRPPPTACVVCGRVQRTRVEAEIQRLQLAHTARTASDPDVRLEVEVLALLDVETEIRRLRRRVEVLRRAESIAAADLADVRSKYSHVLCAAEAPAYRAEVREVARLAALLADASAKVNARRQRLAAAGVEVSSVLLPEMGHPATYGSAYGATQSPNAMAAARRFGFVDDHEDPREFRAADPTSWSRIRGYATTFGEEVVIDGAVETVGA